MNSLKSQFPPAEVLRSFRIAAEPIVFSGGLHGAFRAGDAVLKKVDHDAYYEWLCDHVFSLPVKGLRIPQPLQTRLGAWIEDGWCAYSFLEGENMEGQLATKVEIARRLHNALRKIETPPPMVHSPWKRSERVAWLESPADKHLPRDISTAIRHYLQVAGANVEECQCVHSDLSGNILAASNQDPAIIDFSLVHRPTRYAEAVLVFDSILWGGGRREAVTEWFSDDRNLRELSRAAVFRLHVTAELDRQFRTSRAARELQMFEDAFGKLLSAFN